MADTTKIEWTDATWQIITGCTLVSQGCRHCYAARLAATRLRNIPSRAGLARLNASGEAKFTGEVRFNQEWLDQPLRWKKPRRIFVCAHGDLFHENVPDEWIDKVFAVMALAPQHTFQVLTKRPERARAYIMGFNCDGARRFNIAHKAGQMMEDGDGAHDSVARSPWPLPNVWLGTSIENQATAKERIPHLLATPAAVRFVSAEPLLGKVDLTSLNRDPNNQSKEIDALTGYMGSGMYGDYGPRLDWVIVGGESGPGARPMKPKWALSLRDQCQANKVAFFFKQWGAWAPQDVPGTPETDPPLFTTPRASWHHACGEIRDTLDEPDELSFWCEEHVYNVGKSRAGRLLDGHEWNQMPGAL